MMFLIMIISGKFLVKFKVNFLFLFVIGFGGIGKFFLIFVINEYFLRVFYYNSMIVIMIVFIGVVVYNIKGVIFYRVFCLLVFYKN